MPASAFRASSLVAFAAALTACGGGGGGGDSPTPAPQTPPPIAGPVPPAPMAPISAPPYPMLELTAANAPDAVEVALRALGEAPPLATFAVFVVDLGMNTGSASFGPCAGLPPGTPTIVHFDVDANGAISRGDILRADFQPCTGSAGTMVIRPTLVDVPAQRLEARVEFTTQPATGDTIEGSFDLATTFAGAPRVHTLSDFGIVVRENGQATYVTAGRIEAEGQVFAPRYSLSFAGTVASESLGRSYRLTTTTLRGDRRAVPSEGEIVVEGSPARARITQPTDPVDREDMASLAVDATGSGAYGAATLVPWARMLRRENVFGWFPNTRPRITRLEITPPNPTRLDTLVPSYDAIDHDGDPLQFSARWSRNGVPFPQPSPTLTSGNFVRGDVIELTLQAQDNTSSVGRRSITFTIANAPPTATATVTPTAPLSVQDLALSSTAMDPDGDALTTTYGWRVNGNALGGQTVASLSHTAHAKNDVVTGVVAVNDGFVTVTAEASVTILDSPGKVTVPTPPTGATYGNTVSFTAVASDYDGDDTSTKDFHIVYGPAGMAVHPDTGVVSWAARGPMFERTLRVNYGVSIDEPGASIATGSFVVADPNRVPPLARGVSGHPDYGGLRVADLDSDGDLETLVAGDAGVYELANAGAAYRQTWADFLAFGNATIPTAMAAGDIDGDNLAEIFVAYGDTIVTHAGTDRAIVDRVELPVPTDYMCKDLELADLDGNGSSEVVCLATYFRDSNPGVMGIILVLAADTLDVVKQYPLGAYGAFIAVGNVDDDTARELVTAAGHVFDGVAAVGPTFAKQWPNPPTFGWTIEAGDIDGDGIDEIIGLENVANVIRAFDARTLTQRWSLAHTSPVSLHVADVTGDASAEILVGDYFTGLVTAYRQDSPAAASALFSIEFGDNAGVQAIAAGNLDADGGIEIIAGGVSSAWFGVAGRNPNPEIEWRLADSPEAQFGFLGGEQLGAELVFLVAASDGAQRFGRFDTADGGIELGSALGNYGDFDAAFAVVDYDDDGVREALLAAEDENNAETRVLAYDLTASTVDWATSGAVAEGGPADVAYADFTGDGRDELVVLTDAGGLRVYNVGTNTPLYERAAIAVAASTNVAIANLDGAGMPEILATIDDRVVVFSRTPTGFAITATSAAFIGLRAMEVTDIDGDGLTDVFVLYGNGVQARLARLDRFLLLRGEALLGQWANDMTTERSSFARKNLVFWRSNFTSDMFAADPLSGAEVWRAPRFIGFIGPDSVRYHDLAGNGDWSVSVGAGAGITLSR